MTETYDGYKWIKVKKYVQDSTKPWEDQYVELEAHHVEETTFLIAKVRQLAARIRELEARYERKDVG